MTTPADPLEFIASHHPGLASGDTTLKVSQTVTVDGEVHAFPPGEPVTQELSVLGPRFGLEPREVASVFPAAGSLGEHADVLPHALLRRSTLPWERSCVPGGRDAWLALLLFDEDEAARLEPQTLSLAELKRDGPGFPAFVPEPPDSPDGPYLLDESGDHDDDRVRVISLDADLQALLPGRRELNLLCHVRRSRRRERGPGGAERTAIDERAVVVANRLPRSGAQSTVHLVSLENRYRGDAFAPPAGGEGARLVSLYSWRFACVSRKHSFTGLLTHLNHPRLFSVHTAAEPAVDSDAVPPTLRQAFLEAERPLTGAATVADRSAWRLRDGGRDYLVGERSTVYDPAGRKLFAADRSAAGDADPLARLTPAFERHGRPLGARPLLRRDRSTLWIEDGDDTYVVAREANALHAHHLDRNVSSTLRLPPSEHPGAERYLRRGRAPLPHAMRQGNRAVSWYGGPLVPGASDASDAVRLPVRAADELVRYGADSGMFDVSYAAAWELGRLLTLRSKRISVELFDWKRTHARALAEAERRLIEGATHLPFEGPAAPEPPASVREWFAKLGRLEGVPFNYLVPDERMLPRESIRFFQLDGEWIRCLLDGAFGIGRVLPADHEGEPPDPHGVEPVTTSGALLRSDLVAGWPHLQVDGYGADDAALEPLRVDRLTPSILICLFAGRLEALDVHQRPEALHFGLARDPDGAGYHKVLRGDDGSEDPSRVIDPVPFRSGTRRVLDVAALAGDWNAATFALQMIEGVERVRFGAR